MTGNRKMDKKHTQTKKKKHFVLVHGFCHGAWCWYKLVSLMKMNGHDASAVDLGGCGIDPRQIDEIASVSDYVRPLMDFLAALPEDQKVVLVGHSYGGIPVALAMENFPAKVSLAVFVTALMPNCEEPPGSQIQEFFRRSSIESLMDCKFTFDEAAESLPISAVFGPDYLSARVYTNCTVEDLELCKMLARPSKFFMEEMRKPSLLSEARYGKIKRCYVICKDDQVMEEDFQRYIVEKSTPEEVVSIRGAGHMVLMSRTQQLCSCMLELAEKYY